MASSKVTVWSRLRLARGPVCSTALPSSMESWTEATTSRAPARSIRRSRKSITSGKLWPVSTCMTGNGIFAGANARMASSSMTTESLPPEKSRHGRSNSAATSRMMWMPSASRDRRWESS